eukprot:GHVS01021804.1.p1 GENE.GHVS01021804.1~~GHVS01021804.1.p1  ORF type:complete len:522 (+),score=13.95 GHVS01021804.1:3-1568(+)
MPRLLVVRCTEKFFNVPIGHINNRGRKRKTSPDNNKPERDICFLKFCRVFHGCGPTRQRACALWRRNGLSEVVVGTNHVIATCVPTRLSSLTQKDDAYYMDMALRLARQHVGTTRPNPPVGCLILSKSHEIIAIGAHVAAGQLHAEADALQKTVGTAVGGTAYVTLEPCNHFGRTPPCCDALIRSGVSRVVIGSQDPNSVVAGKGIQKLRSHGVVVDTVKLNDGQQLLQPFEHRVLLPRNVSAHPGVSAQRCPFGVVRLREAYLDDDLHHTKTTGSCSWQLDAFFDCVERNRKCSKGDTRMSVGLLEDQTDAVVMTARNAASAYGTNLLNYIRASRQALQLVIPLWTKRDWDYFATFTTGSAFKAGPLRSSAEVSSPPQRSLHNPGGRPIVLGLATSMTHIDRFSLNGLKTEDQVSSSARTMVCSQGDIDLQFRVVHDFSLSGIAAFLYEFGLLTVRWELGLDNLKQLNSHGLIKLATLRTQSKTPLPQAVQECVNTFGFSLDSIHSNRGNTHSADCDGIK